MLLSVDALQNRNNLLKKSSHEIYQYSPFFLKSSILIVSKLRPKPKHKIFWPSAAVSNWYNKQANWVKSKKYICCPLLPNIFFQ